MKTFVAAVLLATVCVTVAYDDPVTGECGKDWEPRDPADHEFKIAAEYAAHVNSQLTGQEYKDQLKRVVKAFIKDCRWPKYNFTAIYGISTCKVGDFDTTDCSIQPGMGLRQCRVYMWVPPGRGSRLEDYICEPISE